MISTHQFIYADGHVCVNMPSFVSQTPKGVCLTAWALSHLDECCLKFKKHYRTNHENYKIGELHSDQEYNERYGMIHAMKSAKIAGLTPEEVMMKNVAYLESFPRTPAKAMSQLVKDRCRTNVKQPSAAAYRNLRFRVCAKTTAFLTMLSRLPNLLLG